MQQMSMIRDEVKHNYWARDRQLHVCASLTTEQFLRPLAGSFPSLRDTLVHMVAVEWLWLVRCRGRSPKSLLSAGDFPTLEAVVQRWNAVEREMREYLAALDEEALARPLTYMNFQGEEWTYPLWEIIAHVLNHQSYHRGQVTTLLRMLGVQTPHVDFLVARDMDFQP
jgi:uncharacterized damage-inducible protein DinB